MAEEFNFFEDDLPHPETLIPELLQWRVINRQNNLSLLNCLNCLKHSSLYNCIHAQFSSIFNIFIQVFWKNSFEVPTTLKSALKGSSKLVFPNIHTILRILLTFPVTTCTCERSISVLNRVKTFNRTTQTDERLSGLCIICAYRGIDIDWDKVVNTFASQNPRRMALINIMDDNKSLD